MTRIKGQNDQEFFSFLVVLPFFFNKSGCSIQGHGVLEWNTFGVFKKNLKRVMVRDGICGVLVDALKAAVAISNLSYVVSGTLSAPIPNFIQI